jgi:hypothetical protein
MLDGDIVTRLELRAETAANELVRSELAEWWIVKAS